MMLIYISPEIVKPSGSLIKIVVYLAVDVVPTGTVCLSAILLEGNIMIRSTLTL